MAGLEVIVRPVVFPDIRPARARQIAPSDDPEKGFCVIRGASGQTVDLSSSYSVSATQARPVERSRRVDRARVYQDEGDGGGGGGGGEINRDNYVDMEVANRIETEVAGPVHFQPGFGDLSPGAGGGGGAERTITYYRSIDKDEAPNIEILQRNIIKQSQP
jgi:hypothetical protein